MTRELSESDDEQSADDAVVVLGDRIAWGDSTDVMGPTPQKHGRFLGLFDCLSPEQDSGARRDVGCMTSLSTGCIDGKRKSHDIHGLEATATATKKQKKQREKEPMRTHVPSPAKTPTVLKRRTLVLAHDAFEDDDDGHDDDSARPRLLFTELPKRGLSVLISELRQMEDEDEDEGMNVLREMESSGYPFNGTGSHHDKDNPEARGWEEGGVVDVPRPEEVEDTGRVKWKKKGLKRSHRRVIMRPQARKKGGVGAATTTTPGTAAGDKVRGDCHGGEEGVGISDDDEYINSADEAAADVAAAGRATVLSSAREQGGYAQVDSHGTALHPETAQAPGQAQGQVKPPKRTGGSKRPAVVSQNYKSLKLRNSGAKGGNRFGRSRFGGRR